MRKENYLLLHEGGGNIKFLTKGKQQNSLGLDSLVQGNARSLCRDKVKGF